MKFIVSVDMNWGIGKDNDLLMRIPDDMKQFREKTTGNVIVMGRKTLESFPNSKPLPNRLNLVITSNKDYYAEGVVICHSIDEALEKIKELNKDVYIVGGGSIYTAFMPYCNEAIITKFEKVFDADTFIENLDENKDWKVDSVEKTDEYEGVKYKVIRYRRK